MENESSYFCYNNIMKKNVFFILLGCAACIVCIFFVVRFNAPLTEKLKRLEEQCAELEETIEEQKRQIAELKDNCNRFATDPEFVERQARKNHRIRPGEVEFIFDAPKSAGE